MDNPLGRSVGNALEVTEALAALAGEADPELLEVSLQVAREMCALAGVSSDPERALRSGAGRETFVKMLVAQGGSLRNGLPVAPVQHPVPALAEGYVESIDALAVGLACLELGAGRTRKEDRVDHAAGLVIEAPVGAHVRTGEPLAVVHARSQQLALQVVARLQQAWRLTQHEVTRPPHVLARVDRDGITRAPIDFSRVSPRAGRSQGA
jgi:thymidine phosphorylase